MINLTVLNAVPDTIAPSVPGTVVETGSTVSTVTIAWSPAADNVGVTNYVIYKTYVAHSPKGSGATVYYIGIASTSGTTATIGSLSAGDTYYYYISAFDAAGNKSPYLGFTIMTSSTSAPTLTNGNNGLSLGNYAIVGQPFTSNTISGAGVPQATLSVVTAPTGAVWNSTYGASGYFTWTPVAGQEGIATFTLDGVNTSGTASQTYNLTVYPAGTDIVSPTAPWPLTVSQVGYNSLTASWGASSDNVGVTGYTVTAVHLDSRIHPPPYNDQTVTTTGTGTSANLTGLTPSTNYTLSVRAFDAAGNYSAPAGVAVQTITPPPITQTANPLTFTNGPGGSLIITWPFTNLYWLYTVQSSTDLVNWSPVAPANQWPVSSGTFRFTPSPGMSRQFYRVIASPAP